MEYVLITGASSGVGRELAVYLSKSYSLIINGRNRERLEETKSKCKRETVIWQHDLTDIDSIEESLSGVLLDNDIKVSAFVHCAGIMKMMPLRNVDKGVLCETYFTNVFSPELITKVLMSRKINAKALLSIVFISSNISNRGARAFSVYGSSKAGLDGLMRNLSVELAPQVRVNSILPGGMVTEMTKAIYENAETKAQFEKNTPLGIGTPEDIAPVVEFLISEQSRWMTGQQITVDGGRTIDITERSK